MLLIISLMSGPALLGQELVTPEVSQPPSRVAGVPGSPPDFNPPHSVGNTQQKPLSFPGMCYTVALGPLLGLMLFCCYLEILNNSEGGDSFGFSLGPRNYVARAGHRFHEPPRLSLLPLCVGDTNFNGEASLPLFPSPQIREFYLASKMERSSL